MTRLLLPFTAGVEMDVLDSLVRLASHQRATLIPLSLIPLPATNRKGVRLELLQQSKDFLEAVRYKATRCQVPVEAVEVFTHDITQSILTSIDQFHCDSILLASRQTRGSLLNMEIIQHLLRTNPCTLFVVYFPAKQRRNWITRGREYFAHWRVGEQSGSMIQRDAAYEVHADYQSLEPIPYTKQEEPEEQEGSRSVIPLIAGDRAAIR